ncbi:hypothetical protein D3C81_1661020 [compost metagenome]
MGTEQWIVESAYTDQTHFRLVELVEPVQVVGRDDQRHRRGAEQQGLDDFAAIAHQQVAANEQHQGMQ